MHVLRHFLADTGGATAVEYGLIVAVVSLVIVVGVGGVGDAVQRMFSDQDRSLQQAFGH